MPRTFIFAGGGTGGHLFPGIAVAQELLQQEPNARILFVGSEKDLEHSILARYRFEHQPLPVESLRVLFRRPWRFILGNWKAWRGARKMICAERPAAVIGLGGYASAPIAWEAARARIPVILLEQNVIPGRATRWLAKSATAVCVTFEDTVKRLPRTANIKVTGNPVRRRIADLHSSANNPLAHRQLLVLGGSQGADSLNEAVTMAAGHLRAELSSWQIVHQTGPRQVEQVRTAYKSLSLPAIVEPFFDDMVDHYRTSSLVISRAGATTLAELTCAGLPMVLLPYPHAADDHQRANAKPLQERGAAVIVEHHPTAEETGRDLSVQLKPLLSDMGRLKAMSDSARGLALPNAAMAVVELVQSL